MKNTYDMVKIDYDVKGNITLWGSAGGQLEFVSQRVEWRKCDATQKAVPVIVIRFTDHDAQAYPLNTLIEGKYYELEFPMAMEVLF